MRIINGFFVSTSIFFLLIQHIESAPSSTRVSKPKYTTGERHTKIPPQCREAMTFIAQQREDQTPEDLPPLLSPLRLSQPTWVVHRELGVIKLLSAKKAKKPGYLVEFLAPENGFQERYDENTKKRTVQDRTFFPIGSRQTHQVLQERYEKYVHSSQHLTLYFGWLWLQRVQVIPSLKLVSKTYQKVWEKFKAQRSDLNENEYDKQLIEWKESLFGPHAKVDLENQQLSPENTPFLAFLRLIETETGDNCIRNFLLASLNHSFYYRNKNRGLTSQTASSQKESARDILMYESTRGLLLTPDGQGRIEEHEYVARFFPEQNPSQFKNFGGIQMPLDILQSTIENSWDQAEKLIPSTHTLAMMPSDDRIDQVLKFKSSPSEEALESLILCERLQLLAPLKSQDIIILGVPSPPAFQVTSSGKKTGKQSPAVNLWAQYLSRYLGNRAHHIKGVLQQVLYQKPQPQKGQPRFTRIEQMARQPILIDEPDNISFSGMTVLLVDDTLDSEASVTKLAQDLRRRGVRRVYRVAIGGRDQHLKRTFIVRDQTHETISPTTPIDLERDPVEILNEYYSAHQEFPWASAETNTQIEGKKLKKILINHIKKNAYATFKKFSLDSEILLHLISSLKK